ncbi:STM2901 family protein [Trinickia fusca]|uniref:Uncharacterized protein n=1 Tax=Trinickia fusca TaxID=2419777 RepID=A0A494X4J1_9BURK|nr:hypothetical protein [Trinickia fusca]RKP45290.1 hypothetical protein D7S89_20940 [Trinickia fusca]
MSENRYRFFQHTNLSAGELFFFVTVDETEKQLGFKDLAAVSMLLLGQNDVPVAGKLGGATAGTSVISIAARKLFPLQLRHRLPTIVGIGPRGLRIAFTRSLGGFVGRAIPVIGVVMMSYDAFFIMRNTVATYNRLVKPEDKVL